jgi:hypothetical protein
LGRPFEGFARLVITLSISFFTLRFTSSYNSWYSRCQVGEGVPITYVSENIAAAGTSSRLSRLRDAAGYASSATIPLPNEAELTRPFLACVDYKDETGEIYRQAYSYRRDVGDKRREETCTG